MKNIAFTFILATLCLAVQAQHSASDNLYTTKSFKDASPKKIVAGTSHGNISVSDVPASQTRVEVYIHSGNGNQELTKQEIQKKLDEYYTLEISLSGDVLSASVKQKKDMMFNETGLSISWRYTRQKQHQAFSRRAMEILTSREWKAVRMSKPVMVICPFPKSQEK